jgi:hypothetical protein
MAINYNNNNQGIGDLDLSQYGLIQPDNNINNQQANWINTLSGGMFGTTDEQDAQNAALEQIQEIRKNQFEGYPSGTNPAWVEEYKGDYPDLYEKYQDKQKQIQKIKNQYKGVEAIDQASLDLPANDQYAMAISNYDQLFGPKTMTDAFGTTHTLAAANKPDLYTGDLMAKTGQRLRDPFAPFQNSSIPQNFRTRMNNPFFERPTLSNASTLSNYLNQGLGGVTGIKEKMGQGWDFAKQLPGMAMSALSGIPGAGLLMGMLPKTSPEQKAMMELYNSEDYQNVLNQIPGMANYNPVYAMGSGYGLTNAINKRLATLAKTRKRQGDDFSDTLRKREEDLKNLLAQEASKDFARIGASGRRPGSGSGPTTQDTAAAGGYSPGQAGAGTGGYSYDSGGRQGYGYGLKYGGRVGYANGGLASLFTRRG